MATAEENAARTAEAQEEARRNIAAAAAALAEAQRSQERTRATWIAIGLVLTFAMFWDRARGK